MEEVHCIFIFALCVQRISLAMIWAFRIVWDAKIQKQWKDLCVRLQDLWECPTNDKDVKSESRRCRSVRWLPSGYVRQTSRSTHFFCTFNMVLHFFNLSFPVNIGRLKETNRLAETGPSMKKWNNNIHCFQYFGLQNIGPHKYHIIACVRLVNGVENVFFHRQAPLLGSMFSKHRWVRFLRWFKIVFWKIQRRPYFYWVLWFLTLLA